MDYATVNVDLFQHSARSPKYAPRSLMMSYGECLFNENFLQDFNTGFFIDIFQNFRRIITIMPCQYACRETIEEFGETYAFLQKFKARIDDIMMEVAIE